MGRGSKIFIVAFLVSACVFGLISFAIVSALYDAAAPSADGESLSVGAVTDKYAQVGGRSFNLLLINVDYRPEMYSYDTARVKAMFGDIYGYSESDKADGRIELLSAVLIRVDKERGEFTFTPVPSNTYITLDGGKTTFGAIYESRGIRTLCECVHTLTGITVDEYAVLVPSAAEKITDKLGGVDYNLVSSVSAAGEVAVSSGKKSLGGEQIRTLMLCDYSGLSTTREKVASELARAFLEKLTQGGEASVISICGEIISSVQTSVDIDRVTDSAPILALYGEFKKSEISLCGKYTDNYFVPDLDRTVERFSAYRKYYG